MKDKQKEEIKQLRKNGLGYKCIGVITGVSLNTMKSYCRRQNVDKEVSTNSDVCLLCQAPLVQKKGKKPKKFCSDTCRMKLKKYKMKDCFQNIKNVNQRVQKQPSDSNNNYCSFLVLLEQHQEDMI